MANETNDDNDGCLGVFFKATQNSARALATFIGTFWLWVLGCGVLALIGLVILIVLLIVLGVLGNRL